MIYVLFKDDNYKKNLSSLDVTTSTAITKDEFHEDICRGIFTIETIMGAIDAASFVLYEKNEYIIGIMCVTVYGNMWEISYICADAKAKGTGTNLLQKLIEIVKKYELPITIYGLALWEGSQALYKKNGFTNNQLTITTGGRLKRNTRRFNNKNLHCLYRKNKRKRLSRRSKMHI
jgi:GNAT superfamily N-acetyltransferase